MRVNRFAVAAVGRPDVVGTGGMVGVTGIGLDFVLNDEALTVDGNSEYWPASQYGDGNIGFIYPEAFPRITEALLARGYDDGLIRGILGENFLRVAGEVWK